MSHEYQQKALEYIEKSSLSDDDKEFMALFLDVAGQGGAQKVFEALEQNILPIEKLVDLVRKKIAYIALADKEKWNQLVDDEVSLIKSALQ